MKVIFEDDGFESLTIVDNRKPKESESCNKKCCGNCRYYQRHYIPTADGTAFTLTKKGHCYPPIDHTSIKVHGVSDEACCWFKQTEI